MQFQSSKWLSDQSGWGLGWMEVGGQDEEEVPGCAGSPAPTTYIYIYICVQPFLFAKN